MKRFNYAGALFAGAAMVLAAASLSARADAQAERGKYLVSFAGCQDCHTPGHFLGKRDDTRMLGGSDVGFSIPGLGVFVGPNLTPDKTGLGDWSKEQIVTALRTGKTPDKRQLAPAMPWRDFALLSDEDAMAIATYLKTLKPVNHRVAGPFGPAEKVTIPVMKVVLPQ